MKILKYLLLTLVLGLAGLAYVNKDYIQQSYRDQKNIEANKALTPYHDLLTRDIYKAYNESKKVFDLDYTKELRMTINRQRTYTGTPAMTPGICLTFDDRSVYDWAQARPIFNKYQARASFYISQAHELTDMEKVLLQLLEKDGHEIGSHSLNHQDAVAYSSQHSPEAYVRDEIMTSEAILEELGLTIDSFSYPFGYFTASLDEAILQRYASVRKTFYARPTIPVPALEEIFYDSRSLANNLFAVGLDRSYANPHEDYFKAIDRAKERGEIVVFYSHLIRESDPQGIDIGFLEDILSRTQGQGLAFHTPSQMAGYQDWKLDKVYPIIFKASISQGQDYDLGSFFKDLPDTYDLSFSIESTSSLDPGTHYIQALVTDNDTINDSIPIQLDVQ